MSKLQEAFKQGFEKEAQVDWHEMAKNEVERAIKDYKDNGRPGYPSSQMYGEAWNQIRQHNGVENINPDEVATSIVKKVVDKP